MATVKKQPQAGHALVLLMAFMTAAIVICVSATMITLIHARSASGYTMGQEAYGIAESGLDNAMIRLLRNPAYTGETVTIGTGTATITISGAATKTITSVGRFSGHTRTAQAVVNVSNNTVSITSWKEIP